MRAFTLRRFAFAPLIAVCLCLAPFVPSTKATGCYIGDWECGTESMAPDTLSDAQVAARIALYGNDPTDEAKSGGLTTQVVVHVNNVKVAGDEEWRAHYGSSWDSKANSALERADDDFYARFGIDFRVFKYVTWDSYPDTPRHACTQVNEASTKVGIGAADTVAVFSGNAATDGVFGCSISHYAIVVLHGEDLAGEKYRSWVTSQHEMSHQYGATDKYPDPGNLHPNDVMEDQYNYPGFWCTHPAYNHFGQVQSHASLYD
jgi:hypothetical protein